MAGTRQKTFYLETFGCQMNMHDSEKVVGTLVQQGYRQVDSVEAADLIFYNTCSIRDKAEQKVFHRLQDYKKLQSQGKKFAVLGCVAQQEGEKIFETEFTARSNPHRGYITIIEGCDKFCAYCVVPYTRGKERSRTSESVLA